MHFTSRDESLAGSYDSAELETASRLFLLARANGLTPLKVRQGSRSHDPVLTCQEGEFFGTTQGGKWKISSLGDTNYNVYSEEGFDGYYDGDEDFDYGGE